MKRRLLNIRIRVGRNLSVRCGEGCGRGYIRSLDLTPGRRSMVGKWGVVALDEVVVVSFEISWTG
jgi:hypothetical protein